MQLNPSIILAGDNVSDSIAAAQQPRMNALQMQAVQQDMGLQRQAQQEANVAKLARMVLSSPDPASAYPRALQIAQAMGIPIDGMPREFSPEIGEQLQMAAALLEMPKDQRTEFERLLERMSPEEQQRAIRVRAGLAPAAQGAELRTVGNDLVRVEGDAATPVYSAPEKPQGAPQGYRWSEDGNLEFIGGGPADPAQREALRGPGQQFEVTMPDGTTVRQGPALREFEAKATNFSRRLTESMPRVDETEAALLGEGGASVVDVIADRFGSVGNFVKSDEYRSYQAAAREWIAGLLRLDSGAAVPDSEFERYFNTYFIAPGDDDKTVALKKDARKTIMRAIEEITPPAVQNRRAAEGGAPPDPEQEWDETREIGGRRFGLRGGEWFELP